jgi:hypothetical protein
MLSRSARFSAIELYDQFLHHAQVVAIKGRNYPVKDSPILRESKKRKTLQRLQPQLRAWSHTLTQPIPVLPPLREQVRCVNPVPILRRLAIHFNVVVIFRLRHMAILTLARSPLRRNRDRHLTISSFLNSGPPTPPPALQRFPARTGHFAREVSPAGRPRGPPCL